MSDTYQNFPSTIDKLSAGLTLTTGTYTIGASTIAQISSNQLVVRNYGAAHTIVVFPEEYDYVKTGQKFRLAMILGADRNSGHNFTMSGHSSHPADWGGDYICNVSSNVAGEISVDLSLKKVYSVNNTNWTICAVFNYSGDGSANGANSEAWYSIKEDNSISSPAGDYQGIALWAHGVYRYQATLGLTQPLFQTTAGDTGAPDTEKPIISLTGDSEITVIQTPNLSPPWHISTVQNNGYAYGASQRSGHPVDAFGISDSKTLFEYAKTQPHTLIVPANGSEDAKENAMGSVSGSYEEVIQPTSMKIKVVNSTYGTSEYNVYRITAGTQSSNMGNGTVVRISGTHTFRYPSTLNFELPTGSGYTEQGATWSDNEDGSGDATITGSVDTTTVGTYNLTYNHTDDAGNAATPVTRIVHVVPLDTEKPIISLTGDATISVIQGGAYTELGATWADNLDGSGDATVTGTVDTSTIGTYAVSYNYTDNQGNIATTVTRTINVVEAPDTEKPVITLTGDAEISVIQGDTYTEQGAIWVDNKDGTGDATVSGSVDTSTVGTYTITYNYTDTAGNIATEVTRTVNVEVVGSPPAAFSVPDLIVNENTVVNHEVSPSGGDWTTTVTNLMSPLTLSGNYIVGTTQEVPGYKNVTVSVAQTATVTRTNSYGSTSAQLDILVLNTTEEPTAPPSGVNINSILYKIGLAIKSSNATSSGAVSALDTRVTALETEIDGGTYS